MVSIYLLSENTTYKSDFIAYHGLSILLKMGDRKFLFDFGQKEEIFHNSHLLKEDLNDIDIGILSHGHYDHCGGLPKLFKENSKIKIYAHPEVFVERFSGKRFIGMDKRLNGFKGRFIFKREIFEITNSLIFLGEIKRYRKEDEAVEGFYKSDGSKDFVKDDTSILIKTVKGWILICGCCHSGLSNTILYIKEKFGITSLYGIMGGFHLKNGSELKLKLTKEILSSINLEKIFPMHCTGFKGMKFLIENFGDKVENLNCGVKLEF